MFSAFGFAGERFGAETPADFTRIAERAVGAWFGANAVDAGQIRAAGGRLAFSPKWRADCRRWFANAVYAVSVAAGSVCRAAGAVQATLAASRRNGTFGTINL